MNTADLTAPSSKVIVSTLAAVASTLVITLAANTAVFERLPDLLEAGVVGAIVGLAGYLKRENNPAPSSFGR